MASDETTCGEYVLGLLGIAAAVLGYMGAGWWGALGGFVVVAVLWGLLVGFEENNRPKRKRGDFDPSGPPTEKQLGFIDHLRDERIVPRRLQKEPKTLAEASRLIDELLECEYRD